MGLVRKLLSVLEALEKLVIYSHDTPGQVLNLQTINRRLRFTLERAPGSPNLLDCSGRTLRLEPLVSVDGLEKFLNGIVSWKRGVASGIGLKGEWQVGWVKKGSGIRIVCVTGCKAMV